MFQPDAFVYSMGSTVLGDAILTSKSVHMVTDGIVVVRIRSAQADGRHGDAIGIYRLDYRLQILKQRCINI